MEILVDGPSGKASVVTHPSHFGSLHTPPLRISSMGDGLVLWVVVVVVLKGLLPYARCAGLVVTSIVRP